MSSYKIDLHTHSEASPDGGLSELDYRGMHAGGTLDFVAITDHNTILFAKKMHKALGEKIIIGEEITAREGEIIGLFLDEVIPAGLSTAEVVAKIHAQGGLVYIPHPFETVRKGLPVNVLDEIGEYIDIVETHNGRAVFQNKGAQARVWAEAHDKPTAASSDAHGRAGWGKTYSVIMTTPTSENLTKLLAEAAHQKGYVGARGILYPKFNRARKMLKRRGRADV